MCRLKELFDQVPAEKRRLSRRLVDGIVRFRPVITLDAAAADMSPIQGEYQDAIELREMLLDAHRPYFDVGLAE